MHGGHQAWHSFHLCVKAITKKELLVSSETGKAGQERWLPLSQVKTMGKLKIGEWTTIPIPKWLAKRNGLACDEENECVETVKLDQVSTEKIPAHEIFGLASGFTAQDITAAYRAIVARVHPDVGGTTGLAKLVNVLRDELLEEVGRREAGLK